MIKIGYSKDPEQRISTLRKIIPAEIELMKIGKGNLEDEREIHKRFNYLKSKGEWFTINDELLEFIKEFREIDDIEELDNFECINDNQSTVINEYLNEIDYCPAKLTKFGNSMGVIIDKNFIELLDLKKGDFLRLIVEQIERV